MTHMISFLPQKLTSGAGSLLASTALILVVTQPAFAAAPPETHIDEHGQDIVVTAPRVEGSVVSPVPADVVLDSAACLLYTSDAADE